MIELREFNISRYKKYKEDDAFLENLKSSFVRNLFALDFAWVGEKENPQLLSSWLFQNLRRNHKNSENYTFTKKEYLFVHTIF